MDYMILKEAAEKWGVTLNRIREELAGIGLTDFIKIKHQQEYTI